MKKKYLLYLIGFKTLFFTLLYTLYQINSDLYDVQGFFVFVSDSRVYFPTIENFINSGKFELIRLPGIFPIYAPLYLIFGDEIARNLIIILQFVLSIWSTWLFSKIIFEILGRLIALMFLVISALSIHLLDIVFLGIMDSFSISFLLISIYYFFKWERTGILLNLFLSGLFITWSFFLREIGIIPYFIMITLLFFNKRNFFIRVKLIMIFSIVMILSEASWVLTNYSYQNKIVLVRADSFPKEFKAMLSIPKAFGGRFPRWYEGGWFFDRETGCDVDTGFPFSDRVFTSDYNKVDLINLKKEYCGLDFSNDNTEFLNRVEQIKDSYKKHRWYDYYFLNYLRHLRDYLFETTVFIDLPVKAWAKASITEKLLKVYFIINYNIITIIGLIGLIIIWFKNKGIRKLIIITISPLIFLIFMRMVELRYFYPMIPIFTVGLSIIVSNILLRLKRDTK